MYRERLQNKGAGQSSHPLTLLIDELESLLREEIALHARYADVITEERRAFHKFQSEEVARCAASREELLNAMAIVHKRRIEIMREFPGRGKLTELIRLHCDTDAQARLLPLLEQLRQEVKRGRELGFELSQLTNFSLRLVSGALSILWSATASVAKSYTAKGVVKESHQPFNPRGQGLLEQA